MGSCHFDIGLVLESAGGTRAKKVKRGGTWVALIMLPLWRMLDVVECDLFVGVREQIGNDGVVGQKEKLTVVSGGNCSTSHTHTHTLSLSARWVSLLCTNTCMYVCTNMSVSPWQCLCNYPKGSDRGTNEAQAPGVQTKEPRWLLAKVRSILRDP